MSIDNLSMRFGGIVALDDISFEIRPYEILGLIGPNGSGKTTLFNCLTRIYDPSEGDISFKGQSIMSTAAHDIIKLGISRTFQNVSLFPKMVTIDNIMAGSHIMYRSGYWANMLRLPTVKTERLQMLDKAMGLIDYFDLDDDKITLVKDLPYVKQKRVEFARALMSTPKVLLLDEPACGLNHEEAEGLKDMILGIRKQFNVSIVLVEHHMNLVMSVSNRVIAFDSGQKIAQGTPAQVQQHPKVIEAYLGASD